MKKVRAFDCWKDFMVLTKFRLFGMMVSMQHFIVTA
jgi:hypothetical protein